MKLENQEFYWALVKATVPSGPYARYEAAMGTFMGGPSGTSSAPHLYRSEAKAKARAGNGTMWKVVKVRLEIVE
jgi:hypothetical protein